ncbi:hypothetical protein K9L05_03870 [Candidatus Babeliales bacterium]|nr:hypothetical protein [Candidatus Babeliales bacterium]MCF7899754.1 hypothetical protein [Candidatus Babeliales bacterium]
MNTQLNKTINNNFYNKSKIFLLYDKIYDSSYIYAVYDINFVFNDEEECESIIIDNGNFHDTDINQYDA